MIPRRRTPMNKNRDKRKSNINDKYSLDESMNTLFRELDKGIDDLEHGRMIPADELFAELDAMD